MDQLINENFICDMHVHSQNSHDSICPVAQMAETALQRNVACFAITDHCDIQYYVDRDMPGCIANSMCEIEKESEKFKGKVRILKGIEIGEGLWNETHTKEILSRYDYDVVISAVHAVRYENYTQPYSTIDFSKMSSEDLKEYINQYFDDVLEMLEKVPCDIMAHLTCPFKYINGKYKRNIDVRQYKDKICQILEVVIDNLIAMEINTSGVSTEYGNFMPDEWIIKKFKDMGGYLVTLGSDAHVSENLGKNFDSAIRLLKKYNFKNYYFYQSRKNIPCTL